ncbi:TPA: DNA-3-methyladenine glycosylase 2 family protein, partial [Enterococcus faecium]|nr:DNA-3-methyladenine glycosylase 2 family protein [Enterococcus faecium]
MITPRPDMPNFSSRMEIQSSNFSARLPLPELFNYAEVLYYLSRSSLECLHQVENDRIYKLLKVDTKIIPLQIEYLVHSHVLEIHSLLDEPLHASEWEAVQAYITEWLDLNTNLAPFEALTGAHPILSPYSHTLKGLRIVGVPDLFEALCWAVLGQQINLTFAYTLKKRITEAYGEQHQFEGRKFYLFPTPQDMLKGSVQDLRQLQITTKKSEYILNLAEMIECGELRKEALLASGFRKAEETLVRIRGIGPWTAHYVLMRCLRDPSAFPIGDA